MYASPYIGCGVGRHTKKTQEENKVGKKEEKK
jgi:hypothetical protein